MKRIANFQTTKKSLLLYQQIDKYNILILLIWILGIVPASTQITKKLPRDAYEHVVKPNTQVEVKIIEGGKVKETNTGPMKDIKVAAGSKVVVPTKKNIDKIDAGSFNWARQDPAFKEAWKDLQILPELHIETGEAGTISYGVAFLSVQPFRYDYSLQAFNASLDFFLIPETETNITSVMDPVNIQVVSNKTKTITPDHLILSHLKFPSSKIEFIAEQVSDSAEVKLVTAYNTNGYSTYLKVEPALELVSNQTALQGYGIEKIPVIVRFVGSNSPTTAEVSFSIEKGAVEPTSVQVSYNKPSTIYVISEGTGVAELSAVTNNQRSNTLSFTYTFPWPFLLFSVAGGLIGGLAKHYFNSAKKTFPVKPIIGGILIGFIVAVAYYFLGINLLGLSLSATINEMAVLGISALGAYFGISAGPSSQDKK